MPSLIDRVGNPRLRRVPRGREFAASLGGLSCRVDRRSKQRREECDQA
jgi:hypothetical protein